MENNKATERTVIMGVLRFYIGVVGELSLNT